jgi:hypothetical protein
MKSTAIKNAEDRAIEEIDEETYRAEPGSLKVGDFVEWDSSGGMARGKITRIISEGSVDVPDSSFTIDATEDNSAALIQVCTGRMMAATRRLTESLGTGF